MNQTNPRDALQTIHDGPHKTPCAFFQKGKCSKGQQCAFSHTVTRTWRRVSDSQPMSPVNARNKSVPCKFFAGPGCQLGDSCPYSHSTENGKVVHPATPTKDTRSMISCKFFAQGNCHLSTSCPYLHAMESEDHSFQPPARCRDTRAVVPCKFDKKGQCHLGETCPYLHETSNGKEEQPSIRNAKVGTSYTRIA